MFSLWEITKWYYGGEQQALDAIRNNLTDEQIELIESTIWKVYGPSIILFDVGIFGLGYFIGQQSILESSTTVTSTSVRRKNKK